MGLHVNECHLFLTRCALLCYLVCSSEETLNNNRRWVIVVLLAGLYFLQVTARLRGLRNAQQRLFPTWLGMKLNLCRSMGCVTLHNTGVFFCFQKGLLVLWCFNTPKKGGGGKDERKKAKLYFTSRLKGSLALHIHDCSIFWGSKAAFEAWRYVLIIWRLNDDTEFIINGPHPSTLPLPHNSPESERVLALAAFALFDLSVITPLFGDHTTSFMLNKEALEVVFLSIQIPNTLPWSPLPNPISFLQGGDCVFFSHLTVKCI